MLWADPLQLQLLSYFLQPALQVFTALHEVLNIIYDWKVQAKNLKEVHLLFRQVSVGQNLDQVSKVIATERDDSGDSNLSFVYFPNPGYL